MNIINKVCSFTGYRTQKLNACLAKSGLSRETLREQLKEQMLGLLDNEFKTFQCGMALGTDLMFAQIALELRKIYSPFLVNFTAVIPCLDHYAKWTQADRDLCKEIMGQADNVVYVSKTPYFDGCMAKRNRYLVDTCDHLIAVYDGQKGGTMQTVNLAKAKNGVRITVIDPSKQVLITLREHYEQLTVDN